MKAEKWMHRLIPAGILALCVLCAPAHAQDEKGNPNKWRHSWTGYAWVPAFYGSARARSIPLDVNSSVSDTWNAVQDHGDGNFAGHYEGGPAKYKVMLDLNYWKLHFDRSARIGDLEASPKSWIIELGGAIPVSQKSFGGGRGAKVEMLAGLRYSQLKLKVRNDTTDREENPDQSWVDPFFGARYRYDFNNKWESSLRFDFGGLGIGSDFTYNLVTQFGYRFTKRNTVLAGWRILYQDFNDGGFKWNVSQTGPFLGFNTQF